MRPCPLPALEAPSLPLVPCFVTPQPLARSTWTSSPPAALAHSSCRTARTLPPRLRPCYRRRACCLATVSGPPPAEADRPEFGLGEKSEEDKAVATLSRDVPDKSFDTVLQELTAIQKDGPRNVAILGTRYASYLHQQIIELLTYANVLVGNHVFTSGAGGTNAAVIRGALRAEKPELLTVVLPQSLSRQPPDTQEQLKRVGNLVQMAQNDDMPLDVASQLCNSDILSRCTHFIVFAFHDSDVVLEAARQAKELRMITTVMFLD
jgi:hypothetical protein